MNLFSNLIATFCELAYECVPVSRTSRVRFFSRRFELIEDNRVVPSRLLAIVSRVNVQSLIHLIVGYFIIRTGIFHT